MVIRQFLIFTLIFLGLYAPELKAEREPSSVLFFAGQSREEFSDYLMSVCEYGKHCPRPYGAAFYTSLHGNGFTSPHANVSGDNHQDFWYLLNVYSPLAIQIGLWLSAAELSDIAKGRYAEQIDLLIERLANSKRRIFLRVGYEFDGPHNQYNPQDYIAAYRIIAKRARKAENIELVWHSFAMLPTFQERDVMDWYPGDSVVDWFGISYFQVSDEGYHDAPNRHRMIELARKKGKPILIGEASAIRYTDRQKALNGEDYWQYWYQPFFDLIESTPEIKAVSMINVDWDSQKQHEVLSWGDAKISTDKYVLEMWRKRLAQPYWVHFKK